MERLKLFPTTSWQDPFSNQIQTQATSLLENGHVLFFPKLSFRLTHQELQLLSPDYVCHKSKNISFDQTTGKVRGMSAKVPKEKILLLHALLSRFAQHTQQFINLLFPHYSGALQIGRTSFRPVEITGRVSSYRKDDKRLHVDAFPANPNHGQRILRVFSNINPNGQSRVWRLGEPFETVAKQFLPQLRKPNPCSAKLLHILGITKRYRTPYDHYMLQLHDNMKADETYQQHANQEEVHFQPDTTWVVQTDDVSHAAMSGQHVLEQTFYLPVHQMLDENKSPLRILERLMQRSLTIHIR